MRILVFFRVFGVSLHFFPLGLFPDSFPSWFMLLYDPFLVFFLFTHLTKFSSDAFLVLNPHSLSPSNLGFTNESLGSCPSVVMQRWK